MPGTSPKSQVSVDANEAHRPKFTAGVLEDGVVNISEMGTAQGAVIDGLSTMAGLEITFENGRNEQRNFDQYPILRMRSAPIVEAHFIQSDFPPTGMGEPALPPLAPAICNAIFAATGKRIRTLPLARSGYTI
jgi:isoquinoline 1-oxidoreductase beta subunit